MPCPHGRQRSKCKDCGGGSSVCEHGRQRCRCKECGGSGICEHGRVRSRCQECGGSGICEHGRRRDKCKVKECGNRKASDGAASSSCAGQKRAAPEAGAAGPIQRRRGASSTGVGTSASHAHAAAGTPRDAEAGAAALGAAANPIGVVTYVESELCTEEAAEAEGAFVVEGADVWAM